LLPDSLLTVLIVFNDVARRWMISRTGIELHVKLSLHLLVLLFSDFRCIIFLFILTKEWLAGLAEEPVNFTAHLLSKVLPLHFFLAVDKILKIHILVTWELSVCTLALRPVTRERLPIEVLRPPFKLESKLESHVSWQSHTVFIEIIGGENASNMSVRTNCDRSNLVAALDQISWRQDVRLLQNVKEIEHNNGPTVVFELKWYLGDKSIGCCEVFVKIAQGNSNAVRSFGHS